MNGYMLEKMVKTLDDEYRILFTNYKHLSFTRIIRNYKYTLLNGTVVGYKYIRDNPEVQFEHDDILFNINEIKKAYKKLLSIDRFALDILYYYSAFDSFGLELIYSDVCDTLFGIASDVANIFKANNISNTEKLNIWNQYLDKDSNIVMMIHDHYLSNEYNDMLDSLDYTYLCGRIATIYVEEIIVMSFKAYLQFKLDEQIFREELKSVYREYEQLIPELKNCIYNREMEILALNNLITEGIVLKILNHDFRDRDNYPFKDNMLEVIYNGLKEYKLPSANAFKKARLINGPMVVKDCCVTMNFYMTVIRNTIQRQLNIR